MRGLVRVFVGGREYGNGFSTSVVKMLCRGCSSLRHAMHRFCWRSVAVWSALPQSGQVFDVCGSVGGTSRLLRMFPSSSWSNKGSVGVAGLAASDTGDEFWTKLGVLSSPALMYTDVIVWGNVFPRALVDVCIALAGCAAAFLSVRDQCGPPRICCARAASRVCPDDGNGGADLIGGTTEGVKDIGGGRGASDDVANMLFCAWLRPPSSARPGAVFNPPRSSPPYGLCTMPTRIVIWSGEDGEYARRPCCSTCFSILFTARCTSSPSVRHLLLAISGEEPFRLKLGIRSVCRVGARGRLRWPILLSPLPSGRRSRSSSNPEAAAAAATCALASLSVRFVSVIFSLCCQILRSWASTYTEFRCRRSSRLSWRGRSGRCVILKVLAHLVASSLLLAVTSSSSRERRRKLPRTLLKILPTLLPMLLFPTLSAVPDPDPVDGVRLLGIQCGVWLLFQVVLG